MNIENFFGIPIMQRIIDLSLTNKEINYFKSLEYSQQKYNQLSLNTNVLGDLKVLRIKEIVVKNLQQYIESTLSCTQQFYITNSWIAKNEPGAEHHRHSHPHSIISGVLYLNAKPNSGSITFHRDPVLMERYDFRYNIKQSTPFNSYGVNMDTCTGKIIIFPSHIDHSVSVNNSNEDRITLGFNTFVKGSFGGQYYCSDLNLL